MHGVGRGLADAFVVRLVAFAVVISVFGWVDQSTSEFLKVRSEAIRKVKAAFDEAGVSMPEPIQNVRRLPDPGPAPQPSATTAAAAPDVAEITDTTADHTIKEKVHDIRASGEEDLLSPHAPRE